MNSDPLPNKSEIAPDKHREALDRLVSLLRDKSNTDPEIRSVLDHLLRPGNLLLSYKTLSEASSSSLFALVPANSTAWGGKLDLTSLPVGKYQIVPSPVSRWSLANGTLVTDFHGLDRTMSGWEIGIPKNPIRIGGVIALLQWVTHLGGIEQYEVIDFPPGSDKYEFTVESYGGSRIYYQVQFVIADLAHAYNDNHGICRIDIVTA